MTTTAPPVGRQTVYTGRSTNWPVVALTIGLAVLLVVLGWSGDDSAAERAVVLVLIAAGIVLEILTASGLRVTAGPNGFTVRWGLVGWPRGTYPLDQIASAEVVDLPFHRVSFGMWWTHRRTNNTVRSGPTVKLTLTSGRVILATAPDPALAVATLDAARATQG